MPAHADKAAILHEIEQGCLAAAIKASANASLAWHADSAFEENNEGSRQENRSAATYLRCVFAGNDGNGLELGADARAAAAMHFWHCSRHHIFHRSQRQWRKPFLVYGNAAVYTNNNMALEFGSNLHELADVPSGAFLAPNDTTLTSIRQARCLLVAHAERSLFCCACTCITQAISCMDLWLRVCVRGCRRCTTRWARSCTAPPAFHSQQPRADRVGAVIEASSETDPGGNSSSASVGRRWRQLYAHCRSSGKEWWP